MYIHVGYAIYNRNNIVAIFCRIHAVWLLIYQPF